MKNDSLAGALPSSNLWKLNFDEKQLNCENIFFSARNMTESIFLCILFTFNPASMRDGKKKFLCLICCHKL